MYRGMSPTARSPLLTAGIGAVAYGVMVADAGTPVDVATRRRRKLFMNCDLLGLTDEERIELACIILRRDIESFSDLDDAQVCRMLDATEGAEKVIALYRLRA